MTAFPYQRILQVEGRPLSEAAGSKQEERIDREMRESQPGSAKEKELQRKAAKELQDDIAIREDVVDGFVFTKIGEEQRDGDTCVELSMEPRDDFKGKSPLRSDSPSSSRHYLDRRPPWPMGANRCGAYPEAGSRGGLCERNLGHASSSRPHRRRSLGHHPFRHSPGRAAAVGPKKLTGSEDVHQLPKIHYHRPHSHPGRRARGLAAEPTTSEITPVVPPRLFHDAVARCFFIWCIFSPQSKQFSLESMPRLTIGGIP